MCVLAGGGIWSIHPPSLSLLLLGAPVVVARWSAVPKLFSSPTCLSSHFFSCFPSFLSQAARGHQLEGEEGPNGRAHMGEGLLRMWGSLRLGVT